MDENGWICDDWLIDDLVVIFEECKFLKGKLSFILNNFEMYEFYFCFCFILCDLLRCWFKLFVLVFYFLLLVVNILV